MEGTKAQLMVEIMKILDLTQEQIKDINNDIQNAMTTSDGTTVQWSQPRYWIWSEVSKHRRRRSAIDWMEISEM
jgi:hypothetical protein